MNIQTRRSFCKAILLSPFIASTLLSVDLENLKKTIKVDMNGELDDDLFIVRASERYSKMTHCFQMHNPKETFRYMGANIPSTPIYGVIDFNEKLDVSNDEVIVLVEANEREELFDIPELRARTHFKAVDLKIDDKILVPSLLPENNDVPSYPTWFGSEDSGDFCVIGDPLAVDKTKEYNYYKLWENAVCGTGIVFPYSCDAKIMLFNKDGKMLFDFDERITTRPSNLVSNQVREQGFNSHILAEVDGNVFDEYETKTDDAYIKRNAITKMMIIFNSKTIEFELPYPTPYINRIYAISKQEKEF